jgi:phytoene dehydrogenase-like protein
MVGAKEPMAEVVIVGAGVAGLVCALELHRKGVPAQILESSDSVGGRIRTDSLTGFRLDRGFQVLLTAYPEAQRYLDYNALQLHRFRPGALIRLGNDVHELVDPRRELSAVLESTFAPIGTLGDKVRVVRLASKLHKKSVESILESPETTTSAYLKEQGFTPEIIDRFFRPFFGGIFLERALETSSRKFEFVFKMFGEGHAAVPARGMQAIPEQLASGLPPGTIRFGSHVSHVTENSVLLMSGEQIEAKAVVVAVDPQNVNSLLPQILIPRTVATTCFYFAAERPPLEKSMLVLNGDGIGPVNHLAVMSNIAPAYAPAGVSLISVTMVGTPEMGDAELEAIVRTQLMEWFGDQVSKWFLLRRYVVKDALPLQSPHRGGLQSHSPMIDGIFVAGDHRNGASTNGAMRSGRIAAEAVLNSFGASNAAD